MNCLQLFLTSRAFRSWINGTQTFTKSISCLSWSQILLILLKMCALRVIYTQIWCINQQTFILRSNCPYSVQILSQKFTDGDKLCYRNNFESHEAHSVYKSRIWVQFQRRAIAGNSNLRFQFVEFTFRFVIEFATWHNFHCADCEELVTNCLQPYRRGRRLGNRNHWAKSEEFSF